jgi:hypothetical protein
MPAGLSEVDRTRIAETFRLAKALGNRVWPDWNKAPFALLLVTPGHEFLIRHPKPSDDFTLIGQDSVLKCRVWFRQRKYSPDLLAAFPAVSGVPTIVAGQAEHTSARTSTPWVLALLHEHFHQLQDFQPWYYAEVEALGLARGDQTGRWMLNYAFPYTAAAVIDQFSLMGKLLAETLQARQQANFHQKLASYVETRKELQALLKPDDYKYFSFQLWQEGIAHYTEYTFAELAAVKYKPSKKFHTLEDYTPFKEEAGTMLSCIEKELASMQLDQSQRRAFYALGAAEGLVLDSANSAWRKYYFEEKFSLDKHFRLDK